MKKEENTKYDRYTDSVYTEFGRIEKAYMDYLPFTAEKQINLTQKLWELKPNVYPNFDLLTKYSYSEMIAELANHIWQDLTEEEKLQVKGILE